MLRMANAEPRLMNGLQEAVLLLCKAGLKFESTLSVNGLLAITVDQKDVFLVNIKQTVGDSENHAIKPNNGDKYPAENKEISSRNSTSDLELEHSGNDFAEISNNFDQRMEQNGVNAENSQCDSLNENRSITHLDACSGEAMLAKESNHRPNSVRRHSISRFKRPLNLPLQFRFKERQVDFSSVSQQSSSNLEYFAKDFEHAQRDEHEFIESKFDVQAPGINSGKSNVECAIVTAEVDHHLLCQIKQEPKCESHFEYQVSCPLEALPQSESHREEPTDYSQFSAHSYSVHHLLQSQAAAWSREAQSALARTSSLHHNMSTASWPRRQIRTSDKSTCVNCGTNTTTVWRRGKEGQLLCNACGCYYKLHKTHRPQSLMKDNIRRRSRRHQGLRWSAVNALPVTSPHNVLPFSLAWNQQDVEQS